MNLLYHQQADIFMLLAGITPSEEPSLVPLIIILGVFGIGVLALVSFISGRARFHCQRCNGKVRAFGELEDIQQQRIADYYRRIERRTPEWKRVFVCPDCASVYDEFSGEYRSRDQDVYHLLAYCKACGKFMHRRKSDATDIRCNHCDAEHQWTLDEPSGHTFLSLCSGAPVTVEHDDYTFGGG